MISTQPHDPLLSPLKLWKILITVASDENNCEHQNIDIIVGRCIDEMIVEKSRLSYQGCSMDRRKEQWSYRYHFL
jgi:hypothetical protein